MFISTKTTVTLTPEALEDALALMAANQFFQDKAEHLAAKANLLHSAEVKFGFTNGVIAVTIHQVPLDGGTRFVMENYRRSLHPLMDQLFALGVTDG